MSRRTFGIDFAVAILMSVISAYLPISFESINRPRKMAESTELDEACLQIKSVAKPHFTVASIQ